MRFHGIAADWVTDFKAEVEQRFNKNHKVIFDYLFKSSYMPV